MGSQLKCPYSKYLSNGIPVEKLVKTIRYEPTLSAKSYLRSSSSENKISKKNNYFDLVACPNFVQIVLNVNKTALRRTKLEIFRPFYKYIRNFGMKMR